MSKKDLTVLIGRFSPFHNGHAELLTRALKTSKVVLVLIGSVGQARNTKNPFSFEERQEMIYSWFTTQALGGSRLKIKGLMDYPYNTQAWIRDVQNAVDLAKNEFVDVIGLNPTVYLTGANRDKTTWYLTAFGDLFKLDLIDEDDSTTGFNLSATSIRDVLFSEDDFSVKLEKFEGLMPSSTLLFLKDFIKSDANALLVKEARYLKNYAKIYEGLQYPVTIQCVDACVIQSGHVLVVVRDNFPGNGLWCLPGGHIEVDRKERLIDASIRELIEETAIGLSPAQLYGSIKSKECFDDPDRDPKGRVITMCYLLKLDDSKPLPKIKPQKGEAKKVMWVPINEALRRTDQWFVDHWSILHTMYGRLGNL